MTLWSIFFNSIRNKKSSPVAAEKSAATSLYNVLKPYVGCYRSPSQQETVQIRGLLTDTTQGGERAQRGDARADQHPYGTGIGERRVCLADRAAHRGACRQPSGRKQDGAPAHGRAVRLHRHRGIRAERGASHGCHRHVRHQPQRPD